MQPLLSRRGKPGLVLHLVNDAPLFLYGPQPREAMLTEIAAAGFPVDGAEQMVSRRWAHTPRRRPAAYGQAPQGQTGRRAG